MKKVYSVYDKVAMAFLSLVVFPHNAPAVRAFREALTAQDSPLSKNPGDYELYYLGELRDEFLTGQPCLFGDVPELVVAGSSIVEGA